MFKTPLNVFNSTNVNKTPLNVFNSTHVNKTPLNVQVLIQQMLIKPH